MEITSREEPSPRVSSASPRSGSRKGHVRRPVVLQRSQRRRHRALLARSNRSQLVSEHARACAFYGLLSHWRPERTDTGSGAYWGLGLGGELGGGVVDCETPKPLWLPYVEVADVAETTGAHDGWAPR